MSGRPLRRVLRATWVPVDVDAHQGVGLVGFSASESRANLAAIDHRSGSGRPVRIVDCGSGTERLPLNSTQRDENSHQEHQSPTV